MRITLFVSLSAQLFLSTPEAWALSCEEAWGSVIPSDGKLAINGEIVLNASGRWTKVITEVRSLNPRLIGKTSTVSLRIVELNTGLNRAQVVLSPAGPLALGEKYELHLDGVGPRDFAVVDPQDEGRWQTPVSFRITPRVGANKTRWRSSPVAESPRRRPFAKYVGVAVSAEGPNLSHYRLELLDPKSKSRLVAYRVTQLRDGKTVLLGHDGCSGEIQLSPKGRYLLRVEAVDAAGQRVEAPGGPVEVEADP